MMHNLILSCNTGEGHNSCARAMEEYYKKIGESCRVEDGLQFISPGFSKFISWGHSFIYKYLPWLFCWGYGCAEKHPSVFGEKALLYRLLTCRAERLYRYIKENEFDTVICTHVFTALMLTEVLRKHPMDMVTAFVATDYTCSPSTKDSCLDYYFIPDPLLTEEFVCENIPIKKIVCSGIPVRQMFYENLESENAKDEAVESEVTKYEGVKYPGTEKKRPGNLLIMCGSMGCGPIKKLLQKLSAVGKEDWEITVVCGRNERLRRKLSKRYGREKHIHIKGYVQNMAVLMEQADLYLTKPGGISVSEAAVKGLPMLLVDAVAGCEEYNRRYFVAQGGAGTAENPEELAKACVCFMEDEERLCDMRKHLEGLRKFTSSQIIFETLKEGHYVHGEKKE